MLKEPVNGVSPAPRLVAAWSSRMVLTKLSVQGPRGIPPSMKALIRLTFVPAGDVRSIPRSERQVCSRSSRTRLTSPMVKEGTSRVDVISARLASYGFGHIGTRERRDREGINLETPGFQGAHASLCRISNRERPDSSRILPIEPTERARVH